jgi:hypothetical protein
MAKKKEKGQTAIYKTLHRKQTKDWVTWTPLKTVKNINVSNVNKVNL